MILITLTQLEELQKAEAASLHRDVLSSIDDLAFDSSLPLPERLEKYLVDIKNPYHFYSEGILVHITYEGSESLSKKLIRYFSSL